MVPQIFLLKEASHRSARGKASAWRVQIISPRSYYTISNDSVNIIYLPNRLPMARWMATWETCSTRPTSAPGLVWGEAVSLGEAMGLKRTITEKSGHAPVIDISPLRFEAGQKGEEGYS